MSFFTLPHEIKQLIAGFLLNFDDSGCQESELIEDVIKLWTDPTHSKLELCGLYWPGKENVPFDEACRRGNMPLMKHMNRILTHILPLPFPNVSYNGVVNFGYIPHVKWLKRLRVRPVLEGTDITVFHDGMIKWLVGQRTYSTTTWWKIIRNSIFANGTLVMIKSQHEESPISQFEADRICTDALGYGKVTILSWMKSELGVMPSIEEDGYLDTGTIPDASVQWIYDNLSLDETWLHWSFFRWMECYACRTLNGCSEGMDILDDTWEKERQLCQKMYNMGFPFNEGDLSGTSSKAWDFITSKSK